MDKALGQLNPAGWVTCMLGRWLNSERRLNSGVAESHRHSWCIASRHGFTVPPQVAYPHVKLSIGGVIVDCEVGCGSVRKAAQESCALAGKLHTDWW